MTSRTLALVVALALVAVACGGSDGDSSTDAAAPGSETDVASPTATPVAAEPTPEDPPPTEPPAEPTSTPTPEHEPTVTITAEGLPDLDPPAAYEAWLVVDDQPVSVGTFQGFGDGVTLPLVAPAEATAVLVTVETDGDPAPSQTQVLAGPLEDGQAELATTEALGLDFIDARGTYILATPTDGSGPPENERSGIWWTLIPREQSLVLPTLPAGWIYEGWQVIDGAWVTSGTFVSQFGEPDLAAPFSGPQPGPPFPGEDFLQNAPDGLTFPVDLRGSEVVITVEPFPDTSTEPFPLIPLHGIVPDDAIDHTHYDVDNVAEDLPTGLAVVG